MFKRVTWFTVGAVVGAGGTVVGYLRARDLARQHVPESVQDAAVRAATLADTGVRVVIDRTSGLLGDWRATADDTRRTRQQTEDLLRRQLERSGL
jgi:hypothetical protein